MFIQINNVGKVREASIEIDGITVIAGENNTGKSTVGRVLFAIFNGFCNVDETLMKEREQSIFRSLWELEAVDNFDFDFQAEASSVAEDVIRQYRSECIDSEQAVKLLEDRLLQMNKGGDIAIDKDELPSVLHRVKEALDIPKQELLKRLISDRVRAEFKAQINNIYTHEASNMTLRIKNNEINLKIENDIATDMSGVLKLNTQAIYLDDEAISCLDRPPFFLRHEKQSQIIYSALNASSDKAEEGNLLDSMMTEERLRPIISELNNISSGNLSMRSSRHSVTYEDPNAKEGLNASNLSSGLKMFALLKLLLLNGKIRNKGLVILDEPEIHLHPEWQIKFAEIIVMLQRAFDLHVLLTTHSPYFIQAIETYSYVHKTSNRCRYYQAEDMGKMADVKDVSENIESIYKKLAKPFQVLENVAYRN